MVFLKQDEVNGTKKKTKKDWRDKYVTREQFEAALASPPTKPEQKRERIGGPSDYGRFYWCVKTELSENGEIYIFAAEVIFTPIGGVNFLGVEGRVNLALAPGQWSAVYAASCFDGSAVAVEHWKGEVQR